VLFGMRSDARELATDSDPAAWMWGGKHTEAALEKFAREGECQQPAAGVCPHPCAVTQQFACSVSYMLLAANRCNVGLLVHALYCEGCMSQWGPADTA
jgi:hypothetical protein